MKIGIIREGKVPPDSRVPLTPQQCAQLMDKYPVQITVQRSPNRCYTDAEYQAAGVPLSDEVNDCEVLMGVKEVPIDQLIPGKIYFFFSHTFKKQVYNRGLLQAILAKNIHLIDYEALTDDDGKRLIAFGKFAGMVGAHNGLYTFGERTGLFSLPRMKDCHDYAAAKEVYANTTFPALKIVLTGNGRVANGAALVLRDMGIQQVTPDAFLEQTFDGPTFTQLDCPDYVVAKDGSPFDRAHFYENPGAYQSSFAPYTRVADLMINGIYWDNDAPAFFTAEEMKSASFTIQVIADVTCDIAPVSSIPSTLRPSTIADPIFGYHRMKGEETEPFTPVSIDMMAIDNLPNELPRDAAESFGQQFTEHIIEELLDKENSKVIERASIAVDGALGKHYTYLDDFVKELE